MKETGIKKIRIVIDAMGGDFAPDNEILGAVLASKKIKDNLEIVFCGKENLIKKSLSVINHEGLNYSILDADEVITMDDEPTAAVKRKKNSSLFKGIDFHSKGNAEAFISAGNTGAVMSTATILLGRLSGVSRPTIGSFIPTHNSYPSFFLDVGASIDVKARYLYEFAVMGSIYFKQAMNIEKPKVALLNIGEEKSKGTEEIQKAYEMLSKSNLNFIGNIEGRDMLAGIADVMVCDGFTGNVVLKFAESFPAFLKHQFKSYASENLMRKLLIMAFLPVMRKVLKGMDYEEYGGVPLLGVNGSVIIGHGKSTPKAISGMIERAVTIVKNDVNDKIQQALNISEN